MIPTTFLSKMGVYDVEIQGATLKVRVVDHADLIDIGLSELRSQIETTKVVGLAFRLEHITTIVKHRRRMLTPCCGRRSSSFTTTNIRMIQLCAGNRCLVVHMGQLENVPRSLLNFLADQEIFFVGVGVTKTLSNLLRNAGGSMQRNSTGGLTVTFYKGSSSVVELGDLAARVLKKPNLLSKDGVPLGVSTIAAEVGFPLEVPASKISLDLAAPVFSHEEIKWVIRDVHASYLIGSKLLGLV